MSSNEILDDPRTKKLVQVIRNSFRVRRNQDPLYVDLSDNLGRFSAPQHQVIFGRRGSGKSCLLVHYLTRARGQGALPIYVLADEFKKLTYPDVLIRILISVVEDLAQSLPLLKRFRDGTGIKHVGKELRALLDTADEASVVLDQQHGSSQSLGGRIGADPETGVQGQVGRSKATSKKSEYRERKLSTLERNLPDYKKAIEVALRATKFERGCLLIDDFYLLPRNSQPDIIDYVHRLVRDLDIYLKIATIRHRSTLSRNHPQTIGVEPGEDVEEINLDRTLEDVESTQSYLADMLDWMAAETGLPNVAESHFNPEALQKLTLASGGVPRDFLNIFTLAIELSVADKQKRWLTPKYVWRAAKRLTYEMKLRNAREDADDVTQGLENLIVDLMRFCLEEKKKTAFLIAESEAQSNPRAHELIQQLMDMKLVHVVEPNTSAASGRPGRFEAYTLDFSLFMEPRRRGIEHVEFWERDDDHRKKGIREAPMYPLSRALEAFENTSSASPESYLDEASKRTEQTESSTDAEQSTETSQGELF